MGKGEGTRRQILLRAADLASAEGLEVLTIGRLADVLSMSKSGLFAHFGSKEELQLAVVETAYEVFAGEVLRPAELEPAGLARLLALLERWLGHVEHPVFRGGCFFLAASAEYDDRPGRVRDRIVALTRSWSERLSAEVAEATGRGELRPETNAAQLTFELHALLHQANWAHQLHGDAAAFEHARRAMHRILSASATAGGMRLLDHGL